MNFQIKGAFGRLLDWQLCSEEWAFPVFGDRHRIRKYRYKPIDGEEVDAKFLEFPSGHPVNIEITQDGFIAKPVNPTSLWVGAAKMLFQGCAEMRGDDTYIVGTYRMPHYIRAFQAVWSGGVLAITLFSSPFTVAAAALRWLMEAQALGGLLGFVFGLLAAVAFAAFGAMMLALVRVIWLLTRVANSSGRSKLQAFLPQITVQDRDA